MGREKLLKELESLDAKRVFLALDSYIISAEERKNEMDALRENCAFFKAHGFEIGAWIWAFMVNEKNDFIHMKSPLGKVSANEICPSDENFSKFAAGYVQEVAACGVDLIMYDDDYRYGFLDMGMGCVCNNHLLYMENILGEKLDENDLANKLLSGGKNKYRDAWLEANGYYFKLFAKEMRQALDSVNPDIRFGLCSCMSLWDTDGVDAETISLILAGNTKPFLRLIGAPYWAVNKSLGNSRLQNVIELERMERSWCKNGNVEIFSEGDAYPRPRTNCPANYVELFDMALRADGNFDGILKYGLDYVSNTGYETGYTERHLKNKPLYEEIHKRFGDKRPCGVRVYEKMQKFAETEIPTEIEKTCRIQDCFFSIASKMLSDSTIPTVYEGLGVAGIAFAENINMVSEEALKKGIIIDAKAAKILDKKGIDVGIISIGNEIYTCEEHFEDTGEAIRMTCKAYDMKISEKAKIESRFVFVKEDKISRDEVIGSYTYTNDKGYKFLVFTFDAYFNDEMIYRSYARSLQLKNAIEGFKGNKLPAYSYGNPDLYIMTKNNESAMSVGLWNCFADSVLKLVVELDKKYSDIEFINCSGELENNKVYLSEIIPFAFAGFVVSET